MQNWSDRDSTYDIVKKILQNQSQDIFDRLYQILLAIVANGSGGGGGGVGTLTTEADLVCAVAGTAVQGAARVCTQGVLVVARQTNTGAIYIGDSTVTNASGAKRGVTLLQGGMTSQFIPCSNLDQVYINADNAGDKAGVICV